MRTSERKKATEFMLPAMPPDKKDAEIRSLIMELKEEILEVKRYTALLLALTLVRFVLG